MFVRRLLIRNRFVPLYFLCLTLRGYTAAADEPAAYPLSQAALQCLYTQSASLLEEPADPVTVLLTENCQQSETLRTLAPEGERFPLPAPPALDVEPKQAGQILFLTKTQLRCFRQQFAALQQHADDPVTVVFTESCAAHE